jgi:hypothetical protein
MVNNNYKGLFFRYAISPHKDPRFEGAGNMEMTDGVLNIETILRPGFLAVFLGVILAIIGLAIIVALAVIIEDHGYKFLTHGKGPMLVGVTALVFMIVGYGIGGWLANKIFSRKIKRAIKSEDLVNATIYFKTMVEIIWKKGNKNFATHFRPDDPGNLEKLLEELKQSLPQQPAI